MDIYVPEIFASELIFSPACNIIQATLLPWEDII